MVVFASTSVCVCVCVCERSFACTRWGVAAAQVIALFSGLECGFRDEASARATLHNVTRLMKRGSILLITTIDSAVHRPRQPHKTREEKAPGH